MKKKLLARIDKLDSLSRRDRLSLAAGLIALAVGAEMTVIEPLHVKRLRIEQSTVADAASQQQARAAAEAESAAQLQAALARRAQLQADLAALGVKDGLKSDSQRETLAAFLTRSQRNGNVALVSTQGLPVEPVQPAAPPEAAVDAAAATSAPADMMFRHRAELTLEGDVAGLAEAIDWLERGLAPLRVERVALSSRNGGASVRATVVLTTINQERTWLAL